VRVDFRRRFERFKDSRAFLLCCGLAATILVAWLYRQQPGLLRDLDFKVYDTLARATATSATTGVPVVVDLDEASLARFGQWPWPRYRVALLLARIREAGALAVGLDIVFPEPDRTSPRVLQDALRRDLQVDVGFAGLPDALMDNDRVFGDVVGSGPYVLGYYFHFDRSLDEVRGGGACALHPVALVEKRDKGAPAASAFLIDAPAVICNIPQLSDKAHMSGFFNTKPDPDGIYRKTPLFVRHRDKVYPNLALATLMAALGQRQVLVNVASDGVESVRLGTTEIPVDPQGQIYTKYRGARGTFRYVSAWKVLEGKLDPDELKGKIVFLGTSAAGLLDLRATPFDPILPGVEVHATVVDNILAKDFLQRPAWAWGVELVLLLVAGLLATALLTWVGAAWSLLPLAAGAAALCYGAFWFMQARGFFLSPLYPLLALALNFTLLNLLKYWREEGQKKFLHSTFRSYLSPELIDEMFRSKTNPTLGGEARVITAFFSDVQGFSTFSEKLTASQLVELLNEYLTAMTDILVADRGTLDKYEGDAVVAFFGAPMEVPDHGYRACRVAVAMQGRLGELREKWRNERQAPGEAERNVKGYPPEVWAPGDKWPRIVHEMRVRIGLNSGEIVVGNMGSTMRMNYTMMGDAVNLAARLESGAKQYGVYTLVSQATLDQPASDERGKPCRVGDLVESRFIDTIAVVGKSEPVRVFEVLALKGGLTAPQEELLRVFGEAMEHYLAMRWDAARDGFARADTLELVPEAKVTPSRAFMARCDLFKATPPVPPGEPWDGVFRLTSK
jgi:adenylate cyclase